MATVQRFEELEVWQLARALATKVYTLTGPELFCNDYDLIRQMRRSSGSVMDNIAEGFGRSSKLEFVHALAVAKGEATELKSQCYRALDRQYINEAVFDNISEEIEQLSRKIGAFMNYLNRSPQRGRQFINR